MRRGLYEGGREQLEVFKAERLVGTSLWNR